ncbi:MAG: energy-coupling factor transporter transmembrane component T, partial [Candidatus Bathyarchaeia archaeon]
ELEKGKIIERIRNTLPILVPLFIRSFQRSMELAEAMESRAYGAIKKRTSLYELKMSRNDYALIVFSMIFMSIVVMIKSF